MTQALIRAVTPALTRALFVDLGNVLVRFDHGKTIRALAAHADVPPQDLAPGLFGDLERALDCGELTAIEFFRAAEARCGLPRIEDSVWIPAWRDIFEAVPEALEALSAVPPGILRILVSNTNALHWEGVLKIAPIEAVVDHCVLSFREGVRKPDPVFFQRALARAGVSPGDAVYLDDRPEFVAAARDLGIESFVVARPEDLAPELARLGLSGNARGPSVIKSNRESP